MLLTDFRIQGFRCFEDLTLEGLGDVNLIVGKNSVGKSTLLDALWVYARRGEPTAFWDLAEIRDEMVPTERAELTGAAKRHPDWQALRPRTTHTSGTMGVEVTGSSGKANRAHRVRIEVRAESSDVRPTIESIVDADVLFDAQLESPSYRESGSWRGSMAQVPNHYVRSFLMNNRALVRLWNAVTLTPGEDFVIQTLRAINPEVAKLSFRADEEATWTPIVQLAGSIVPLRSLGDGAMRLFTISMAIAATSEGIVLIDEFENGLHWSVQPMIWRAIIDQAKKQNVQLFVTTHSSDTVNSFSDAVRERTDVEGALFRLEQTEGGIRSVRLNEQSLGVFREREWEAR